MVQCTNCGGSLEKYSTLDQPGRNFIEDYVCPECGLTGEIKMTDGVEKRRGVCAE